jgi:hypothetical protein
VPNYVPTNGLVGWWPFNGNASDQSGNNLNGIVNGASLIADRFSSSSKAYSFNGTSNNISVNNSTLFNTESWSVSAWYKTSNNATLSQRITHKQQGASGSNYMSIIMQNGKIFGSAFNGTSEIKLQDNIVTSDGNWHNVVYTRNQTTNLYKLYVDGVCKDSITDNFSNLANTSSLIIGSTGISSQYWNGSIDDIGIWNRVLTQQEISFLFTGCGTITNQPTNLSGNKGSNKIFTLVHSGSNYNYQWQSNSVALGWQNVPNASQFAGATTNNLSVNNLTVSNHNQLFRVITSKTGCADTSNIVKLTVNDVASDSIGLKNANDSIVKLNILYTNKHDTLYIGSSITSDTLRIAIRTGISSASPLVNSIKVYPNPASTLLQIELEKPGYYTAKLSSVAGQAIVSPTTGTIDISALANGVYILTIYDSNNKLISTNKVAIVK